jgi:phage shock protein C
MERRLTRSRDAMIGGVAAGVANWMNADPGLVRIAWALLVPLTGGLALVAYIVAWIVIPEEPRGPEGVAAAGSEAQIGGHPIGSGPPSERGSAGDRTALFLGGGLILVGLWFLVREYIPDIQWDLIWPLLLVVAGGVILVAAARR